MGSVLENGQLVSSSKAGIIINLNTHLKILKAPYTVYRSLILQCYYEIDNIISEKREAQETEWTCQDHPAVRCRVGSRILLSSNLFPFHPPICFWTVIALPAWSLARSLKQLRCLKLDMAVRGCLFKWDTTWRICVLSWLFSGQASIQTWLTQFPLNMCFTSQVFPHFQVRKCLLGYPGMDIHSQGIQ